MSKRKHGLGLLGLLAITALGMMAFASTALAVTPVFTVNGVPSTTLLDAIIAGGAIQEGRSTLAIPGLNTEINCEKLEIPVGLIASPTDAKVTKILYKECTALSISKLLVEAKRELPCTVSDAHTGNPATKHITVLNPLLSPVEFASGDFGVLAEKISAFINFLSGTGCPLPLKTEVKGEVCFLISDSPFKANDTVEPLIKTSETIQKSCPKRIALEGLESNPIGGTVEDKLLFGAQAAFVTGSATLRLLSTHAGMTLGVLLFF